MNRAATSLAAKPKTNRIRRRYGALSLLAVVMLLITAVPALMTPSTAKAADWAPPRTVYIPETGQSIDGFFLDVWRSWGGATSLGNPITPEVTENGRIVQYFDFARMEYWPEDPNGEVVKFGEIGKELKPVTVFRTAPAVPGLDSALPTPNQELALEMRAWLPLDADAAKKAETDTWRYIPETRHSVQMGFKDYWEATGEVNYLGNPITEEYALNGSTYQVFEKGQLGWSPDTGVRLMPVGETLVKRYQLNTAPQGQGNLPTYSEDLFIPPPTPEPAPQPVVATGEKWIEVNLSSQYLIARQGDTPIAETYVSTGRPGFDTPPGTFYIQYHVAVQTMEGVLGGEYYNVPDVPWVMYFTSGGHAFHGAYWHNNFGAVMSHGCVNMPVDFAAWLYDWAPDGLRVEIHY